MIGGGSFLKGGPVKGRLVRYVVILVIGWIAILSLALTVYTVTPRTYQSGFTLILPGAGAASSVNIESLGQTSSSAASPFGSHSLSPTENYKRLMQSYRVRGHVAASVGQKSSDIQPPKIKLVNQTKLMYVSVYGASPDEAKALAEAWLASFLKEIDNLRSEELKLREDAFRATLASFEAGVQESQTRIIEFQSQHGLISIDQFQDLVTQTERLRIDLENSQAEMTVASSEISRLSALLGISAQRAADVMTLMSDGSFQSLQDARSKAETKRSELSEMFGPNHPEYISAQEEHAGLQAGLQNRGRTLLGLEGFSNVSETFYSSTDERAQLIASLVHASAKLSGLRERRRATEEQLKATQERVKELSIPATELDALLRDHQVAETVFASALARIDTNRTDTFASYPLTQTVESPGLPEAPATPSKKFIALGTIAGVFFFTIGIFLLWIRLPIIRALLKTL